METGNSKKETQLDEIRAWYSASLHDFFAAENTTIFGELSKNGDFDVVPEQRNAWLEEIAFLKSELAGLSGTLLLEFNIPRLGRRIDAVLLLQSIVFVLEFKTGDSEFNHYGIEQVWDYALDLKNFHEASHNAALVPILIVSGNSKSDNFSLTNDADGVRRPVKISPTDLKAFIQSAVQQIAAPAIDEIWWGSAGYHPTPTIIEAARSLYSHHSVDAIKTFDASKRNLFTTSKRVEALVNEARLKKQKVICFITGVPGAGKTLVGLNVATRHRQKEEATHAVFLSGNGPLVEVLCEALTRDEYARSKNRGENMRKKEIAQKVEAFIQNVHHFRDDGLKTTGAPFEHVVIFDEAQRAWNQRMTANFMSRKKGIKDFKQSEPEFLISYMDRHPDWAVIICLVGGGQEINTGEAGIGAWIEAVNKSFSHWHMYISANLTDSEYAVGKSLEIVNERSNTHLDDALHLAVSLRSFRAENVSTFVKALLDCETATAQSIFNRFSERYPIIVTRNLDSAKKWVREHARGTERFGLVASSKAQRLKPHAIDVRVNINPVHWFLNERVDTRSSFYLEDAATEFQVQGLELDWSCVTWDGDLRRTAEGWGYFDFRGDQWTNVNKPENQNYLLNAYRVLLTRARQGMVIFVPPGDVTDPTRSQNIYNPTFDYLVELGIPVLT